ncbi:hypothetical protein OUZ56_025527 [Daphnia magna]|uniref:Uncharacterized protein n=1 Tax=Daphnia magna TaxID=35525 RepID=A0ABQ9ZK41_9CRUS|nr:hypothetical protein OUZ56_025527 [Daphnia magna]
MHSRMQAQKDLELSRISVSSSRTSRSTYPSSWLKLTCRIDPKNVDELVIFHEGPSFLKLDPFEWDIWEEIAEPEESDVNRTKITRLMTVRRYSSLLRIQRVIAWCRKSATNAIAKIGICKPAVGELAAEEMLTALSLCIKRSQELAFAEEVYALTKGSEFPLKSKLRTFSPFLDETGQ